MKAAHKPNKVVELHVRDTLDWDRLLNDRRIEVVAEDGHVELAGSVPTYYEKLRASDDAWTVRGVKAVDNELLVGPVGGAINDLDVAAACNDALDRDRFVPKGCVTATVQAGRVQLRGQVRNHFERQAAELALSRVDGVLGIENRIAISNEPIPSDIAGASACRPTGSSRTLPSPSVRRVGDRVVRGVQWHGDDRRGDPR